MRRAFLLIFSIAICFQVCISQDAERPKVAVVLSGGGAKGFSHIGILKVLEEEGIPIDIIVGTSMGSLVGGLYSIGYTADELRDLAHNADWSELLSDNIPRKELDQNTRIEKQRYVLTVPVAKGDKTGIIKGYIKGQNIINLFCGLIANVPESANFNDFPISFACIGTDLETGKEVVLNSGFLPTAMFSSMAIPGVFEPSEFDGHLLIDGGLVNNFPTDVAKKMGADIIIGVDISAKLHNAEEIKSISEVVDQLINYYTLRKNIENRKLCDIIIMPNIEGYGTSSFYTSAVDTLINRGIKAGREAIDQIRSLKLKYNLQPRQISTALVQQNDWKINDISITGKYSMSENYLRDGLELNIPGRYSYLQIKKAINNLYGTGNFKRAYFNLEDNFSDKRLNIMLEEKKTWDINVGMRVNTRSAVSILLNTTRKDYSKTFGLLSFTADISSNPGLNFLIELDKQNLPRLALTIDGMYTNPKVHLNKDFSYSAELYSGSVKLYSYQRLLRYSIIGAGIKQEFYKGEFHNSASDSTMTIDEIEKSSTHFFGYFKYDNLDDYYFPTKGTELYSEVSLVQDNSISHIIPIAYFKLRNVIKLNRSSSLLLNLHGRILFKDNIPGYLENFTAGHDYEIAFDHHLPFYGLPSIWSTGRNAFVGLAGLRINITKSHYINLAGNYLVHSNEFEKFDKYKAILGGGITYAYKSAIGPIELTVGYSDKYKKPTLSANAGLWF
jgi:NTE family protein